MTVNWVTTLDALIVAVGLLVLLGIAGVVVYVMRKPEIHVAVIDEYDGITFAARCSCGWEGHGQPIHTLAAAERNHHLAVVEGRIPPSPIRYPEGEG